MSNVIVHDPENHLKIEDVWAFISVDEKGDEGLCAIPTQMGMMPMIAADEARLKDLMPQAQKLADMTKKKIKLIKLTNRQEVEVIVPASLDRTRTASTLQ